MSHYASFKVGSDQPSLHNNADLISNEAKAEKRKADWLAAEDAAILKEHVQELMNDPRYETSTLYRRQVREIIEKNNEMIESVLPSTKGPTKINWRIQFSADDYEEVQAALSQEREDARKAEIKSEQEAVARHAALKYVDVTGMPGADE